MRRNVVNLPPAIESNPLAPRSKTVSRRAEGVSPSPWGSTRTPAKLERMRSCSTIPGSIDARDSRTICAMSASLARMSRGSPSKGSSVVPTSRAPSHGFANCTRPPSSGVVRAALQGSSSRTITWAPLAKRSERGAAGSAMRRITSTQGPVALTMQVASMPKRAPVTTSAQSAPVTRPPVMRRPAPRRASRRAPARAAARATAIVRRASFVSWST